ncbi:unnamed protein product, partial [Medioppia subpectinata]
GHFADLINQYSANSLNKEEEDDSVVKKKSGTVKEAKVEKSKLVEAEKAETGRVKYSVYFRYFKAISLFWCIIVFVNYALMQTSVAGTSLWLAEWSDSVERGERDSTAYYLSIYGVLGIIQTVFVTYGWYAMTRGSIKAATYLHFKMLEQIMHSPMSFFDTTPLGRILNRFSKDVDTCDSTLQQTIRVVLTCGFTTLSTLVIISMQIPIFLAIIVPVAIIFYLIQKFYITTSRQLKRLESITKSPIYAHFSETLSGVATIRACNAHTIHNGVSEQFVKESDDRLDLNNACFYPNVAANRWLSIRLEYVANFIILFSALFAVLQRDSLGASQVGLIVSYALSTTQNLNWLVRVISDLETNIVGVERILEYTDLNTEAEWHLEATAPQPGWPIDGNIDFQTYSTKYREGLDLVLKQISIKISAGEKAYNYSNNYKTFVGIVGRTGAGKSSLTLALFRLIESTEGKIIIDGVSISDIVTVQTYDYTSGPDTLQRNHSHKFGSLFKIIIDGVSISDIGLHQLRSRLTIIPQDPILFSGTIRTNLDPFKSYSDDQIWRVLELSHLKAFVSGLDSGLEHKVSEGGENLSVGQRQLICLARALLRNTKVLILDEATAAVDLETDSLIQTTIRQAFADCTVLTIAHRLNTILDSNRVLVLNDGRIAEFDSPENLLSDEKSIFYSLAKDAGIKMLVVLVLVVLVVLVLVIEPPGGDDVPPGPPAPFLMWWWTPPLLSLFRVVRGARLSTTSVVGLGYPFSDCFESLEALDYWPVSRLRRSTVDHRCCGVRLSLLRLFTVVRGARLLARGVVSGHPFSQIRRSTTGSHHLVDISLIRPFGRQNCPLSNCSQNVRSFLVLCDIRSNGSRDQSIEVSVPVTFHLIANHRRRPIRSPGHPLGVGIVITRHLTAAIHMCLSGPVGDPGQPRRVGLVANRQLYARTCLRLGTALCVVLVANCQL